MTIDADDGDRADTTITAVTVGEAARTAAPSGTMFQALYQVPYARTFAQGCLTTSARGWHYFYKGKTY